MSKIITKDGLQQMLDQADHSRRVHIVGRALVVLFNNQTKDEQQTQRTIMHNGIGFTGADAHSGCLTAKCYLANKTLQDWQLEKWLRRDKSGYARICKYHAQLNEAAERKAAVRG